MIVFLTINLYLSGSEHVNNYSSIAKIKLALVFLEHAVVVVAVVVTCQFNIEVSSVADSLLLEISTSQNWYILLHAEYRKNCVFEKQNSFFFFLHRLLPRVNTVPTTKLFRC